MNKNILILSLALIIGGVVFVLSEGVLIFNFGVETLVDLPHSGLLFLLSIHAIGSLITGFIIGLYSGKKARLLSFVAALVYTSTAMITVLIDHYPNWFVLCDILIFTPCALIGSSINHYRVLKVDVHKDQDRQF